MKATTKKQVLPKVGMGATKHLWSDSQAAKVIMVVSPKKIIVGFYKYPSWGEDREVNTNDEKLSIDYEPEVWTQRKSGAWRQMGRPDKWGECYLTLGKAYSYRCMED